MEAIVFTVRELLQDVQLPRGFVCNYNFELRLLRALLTSDWIRGNWGLESQTFGPDAVIVINPFMHYNQYFLQPALAFIRDQGFIGPVVFLSPKQDVKIVPEMAFAWSYLLPDDYDAEQIVLKILNEDVFQNSHAKSTT